MAEMRKILIFSNLISKEDCVVGEKWKMLIKSADKIFLKKKSGDKIDQYGNITGLASILVELKI